MKLFLALAALVAVAYGGVSRSEAEPAWMLMPGPNGEPQLAVLRGPKAPQPLIDPYLDIAFMLYTRDNAIVPEQMWIDNFSGSRFDPAKETKVFMHGYNTAGTTDWVLAIKTAWLNAGDYNVIIADWEEQANGVLYNIIQERAETVGRYIGSFLDVLVSQGGADASRMHCVGHSLGGHGCGCAGKQMSLGGHTLGRATGLDPALPLYDYDFLDNRIAPTDAAYVDIVHTCGGNLGFQRPLGQADFFPNSGAAGQPGCGIEVGGACSHSRAHEFYEESISSNDFVAHACDTWENYDAGLCNGSPTAIMGENSPAGTVGDHWLHTRRNPPYAMG